MTPTHEVKAMIERLKHPKANLVNSEKTIHPTLFEAAAMLQDMLSEREWNYDMDSAPRDGTPFLGFGSYHYPDDARPTKYIYIVEYSGNVEFPWLDTDGENKPDVYSAWMALPPRPQLPESE